MNDFTASNGITIYVRDGGTVQFQHGTREESCGILQIFPHSEWWQTLREFFQAEADERLGRWRWPENPDYVVYLDDGYAVVVNESDPSRRPDRVRRRYLEEPEGSLGWGEFAARAYFDAHPETKPWHDAQIGETWVLLGSHLGLAVTVVGGKDGRWFTRATVHGRVERYELTDPTIAEARRIWPEVAA